MAKKIPDFESEAEEEAFWRKNDAREYINWDNAEPFVNRFFKDKKNRKEILKDLENKS